RLPVGGTSNAGSSEIRLCANARASQLMPKHAFSASSRSFDLNGEAGTDRAKQNSPIIPPA
ncbi:MAG TPA: hypothetical protein VNY08_10025, partial [Bradyrhizobium sp.]|nr:hypothetical protein [Bradyrhizobium sp.]